MQRSNPHLLIGAYKSMTLEEILISDLQTTSIDGPLKSQVPSVKYWMGINCRRMGAVKAIRVHQEWVEIHNHSGEIVMSFLGLVGVGDSSRAEILAIRNSSN